MRFISSILVAASLALLTPQFSEACQGTSALSRQDLAFADVIFEGRVTAIATRPRFIELTLDVHDVVRGELPTDEITIGWKSQYFDGTGDLALEEFNSAYGETTRVAISTPQLADKFCELKLVHGNSRDEETGKIISGKSMQPVCVSSAASLKPALNENIPFVLSNGYRCGRSYLFPAEVYTKMRDYDTNLVIYERAVVERGGPSLELYRDIVGVYGPLPWVDPTSHPEILAARLFREQDGFFTPALETNLAWQETLLDLGVTMLTESRSDYYLGVGGNDGTLQKFRESLRKEILRVLDFVEKDPNYRERFLLED